MSFENCTVFVCGVSGVGKSHLLRVLVEAHPGIYVISAGGLIAEARKIDDPEFLRALPTEELALNQHLLIAGFLKFRSAHPGRLILVDGHTVIETPSGEFFEVSVDVFAALKISAIIHIDDDPCAIKSRREADPVRKRPLRSSEQIAHYQELSKMRALGIGETLRVQMHSIKSADLLGLKAALAGVGISDGVA